MFFNDKQITGTLTRCHDLEKSRVGSSRGGGGALEVFFIFLRFFFFNTIFLRIVLRISQNVFL